MKNLRDTMRQLQKASESLSQLSYDHAQPWNTLSHMQKVLDTNFWENLVELSRQSSPQANEQPIEIVPVVRQTPKKTKDRPKEKPRESTKGSKTEENVRSISLDMFQTDEWLILSCEIPGFERDSLKVALTDQRILEMRGKVKEHPHLEALVHSERTYGRFFRRVRLPCTVSSKGMTVQYQDGILELKLRKDSQMREEKTTIRANL